MNDNYLLDKRILLVDDEQAILDMVLSILTEYGFRNVKTAKNVREAMEEAGKLCPELAILDVMLPDGDGFCLMEQLRKSGDYPILFLTACGEDEDKFKGFGLGADDYMVKPFLPKELIFRIMAILRRSYKDENPLVRLRGCQIDFSRAEVIKHKEHIPLTAKEYDLLCLLVANKGRVLTYDQIYQKIWKEEAFGNANNAIACHVHNLREKIGRLLPEGSFVIRCVREVGYCFELNSECFTAT